MVHIDFCTREGVMKVYDFGTPQQALKMITPIKDHEFQWFNLEFDGLSFNSPEKFINRMTSRSYIRVVRDFFQPSFY